MATRTTTRRRPSRTSSRGSGKAEHNGHAGRSGGRADWKGHIAFGLVEIPVALRTAESRRGEVKFSLVDKRDRAPVGNLRVNKTTGEEVPWGEIVKGYEHEKGDYVLLDESEIKSVNVEASRTIEIMDFVDAKDIHPVYFAEPYYVLPARAKGNRAYALLREALERTGKVGIATVVLRTRQHLAALMTRGPVLSLVLMRWNHELVAPRSLDLPADSSSDRVPARELAMAQQLVESMSGKWKPEQYKDTYHEDVMALIQRKIRSGRTGPVNVPSEEAEERVAPVLDLMPLLQQSLGSRGRKTPASARPRASRAHRKSA